MINSENKKNPEQWKKRLSGRRIYIRTYGCAYNEGDSAKLSAFLESLGSVIVSQPEEADAIIINSCIVIDTTERKIIKEMRSFAGKEIWITGCLPLARSELLADFPDVRIIHPDSVPNISVSKLKNVKTAVRVVQIGPGCTGSCRYCVTRLARGYIRSIPKDEIIAQIVSAHKQGTAEIRLSGQDISSYGQDTGEYSLVSLMEKIPHLQKGSLIRLGMMNPKTLLPVASEVVRLMKKGSFFYFLHLPVQSGSDKILERMNRGYSVNDVLLILDIFRSVIPGITIATDFITGFPGETDEDHKSSLDLMKRMKPGVVHVTRYSYRPGSGMDRKDELPERTRKERSRELIREAYAELLKRNENLVGDEVNVLTTECLRTGSVMGRTSFYDGVVICKDIPPGKQIKVKITGCTPHYLIGEPLFQSMI